MLRWRRVIREGGLIMLMTGMLMACTSTGGVHDQTTDRASTPPKAPAWSDMGPNTS